MSTKIQLNLKLSALFGKYLYQHKILSLPGLGVFTLDAAAAVPESTDKNFHEIYQHITFRQQPVLKPDEGLIDFIRTHTGKIRPLAESDLESYLSDGKILLNIGKPFYFDGIGTLQKNRQGNYDFIPGLPLADRLSVQQEEISAEDAQQRFAPEPVRNYNSNNNNSLKAVLVVLAILLGLAAIVWGGYLLYNSGNSSSEGTAIGDSSVVIVPDSNTVKPGLDSMTVQADSLMNLSPGTEKDSIRFLIETTSDKLRALRRFSQLQLNGQDIRMRVNGDSTSFDLFFTLPAVAGDSARIKDSLKRFYGISRVDIMQ
ncbi:MAG: hypothetical protein ACXWV5_12635 [Flavitalea sp.]